jgi:hypothetical protein
VDPFQVPTVVYYYPEKSLQGSMIGKFDKSTIEEHSDNFLRGRIPTRKPKTHHDEMYVATRDCQSASAEFVSDEDRELEDEILREIMEE